MSHVTGEGTTRALAFRIAVRFPGYVPSIDELLVAFPDISRASAYRYLADYAAAFRALHNPQRLSPAEQIAFAEAAA